MKKKHIVLFYLLSSLIVSGGFSQEDYAVACLQGIKEFSVQIAPIDKEAEEKGLTVNRLKIVTELRFRSEGIKIVDDADQIIWIEVTSTEIACDLSVSLVEWVVLVREPSNLCYARTWEIGYVFYPENEDRYIKFLSRALDEFLNDYYKANPKSAR